MVFRDIYPFFFECVFFPTYPTSVSTDTNRSKGQDPKPTYLPWFFGTYTRFFSDVSFSLPILPPFLQIPIDPRDRIPNLPTYHGFSGHIPVFFSDVSFSLPILPPFLQIPIDPRDRISNLPTYHGFSGHIPVFFSD